jgi:Flp pilus assembly protein TadD
MSTGTAHGAVRRAEVLIDLRRYAEAAEMAAQAVAADPENVSARCTLAYALLEAGNTEESLRAAEAAAAADPDYEWPHRLRALALVRSGRKVDALRAAEEAVRLAPYERTAHQVHAECLLEVRRYGDAKDAANRVREMAPASADGLLLLGLIAIRKRQAQKAYRYLSEAVRLEPDNAHAHNQLGVAYEMLENGAAARESFEAAARLDPAYARPRRNLVRSARWKVWVEGGGVIGGSLPVLAIFALHGAWLVALLVFLAIVVAAVLAGLLFPHLAPLSASARTYVRDHGWRAALRRRR